VKDFGLFGSLKRVYQEVEKLEKEKIRFIA